MPRNNLKNLLELLFVIFSLIIIIYFIYTINAPPFTEQGGLASLKIGLTSTNKPIMIVSIESQNYKAENETCLYVIKGIVKNIGDEDAEDAFLSCKPSIYPFANPDIQGIKELGRIGSGQKSSFEIEKEVDCGNDIRFNCAVLCKNC